MADNSPFNNTLKILLAQDSSLRSLVAIAGMDPFSFFRGADLRGVDLSGQDLRGFNFGGSDLRQANLRGALYDSGAFNGSLVDHNIVKVDEFDLGLEELRAILHFDPRFWYFVQFRSSSLERLIDETGLTYYELARISRLNQATLRKARREHAVTKVTARTLLDTLFDHVFVSTLESEKLPFRLPLDDSKEVSWLKQPAARLVDSRSDIGLTPIPSFLRDYVLSKIYH